MTLLVEVVMALLLTSGAFQAGGGIPARFTCDGADVSPALSWSGAPAGTVSFALIADDPDAPGGTWVHWVLFNLPGRVTALGEGVPASGALPALGGTLQGRNDFRKIGYGGPCPPPGHAHRYYFRLYALDAALRLQAGADRTALEVAMRGHVLEETTLMGTYGRSRR
jgi:Raf kinase inhibitor-like YbhB/YbcL family protein